MLMLLFHTGEERFACSCEHIMEIIPPVFPKQIPHMPDYVAGSIIYGGKPISVVDWCQLIRGTPCQSSFHTRIILFKINQNEFGLMAEKVTMTMNISRESFVDSGVFVKESPFLGGVLTDETGTIQFVDIEKLIISIQTGIGVA